MFPGSRGSALRLLALATLVLALGGVVGGAEAARHQHDGPGLYDHRCPLQALAAVERPAEVVAVVAATPVVLATALVVVGADARPTLAPAADARLRAPPVR